MMRQMIGLLALMMPLTICTRTDAQTGEGSANRVIEPGTPPAPGAVAAAEVVVENFVAQVSQLTATKNANLAGFAKYAKTRPDKLQIIFYPSGSPGKWNHPPDHRDTIPPNAHLWFRVGTEDMINDLGELQGGHYFENLHLFLFYHEEGVLDDRIIESIFERHVKMFQELDKKAANKMLEPSVAPAPQVQR